jgi:beta-lactamase regulating signal transducer with metallopeptidase domain
MMGNVMTILNLINDAIFVSLVNTTLQMTLLIPLIVLVIFLFRIKSATTRYSLWLFVIFGIIALPLITPFISQIDFAKFYNQRATGEGPDDLMRLRMGRGGVGDLSDGGDSVLSKGATKATVKKETDVSLINPVSVAYFLWCAGALFMLCITLDAYRRLRKLRISSPDVKDSVALEMLEQLKRKIGVARPVALKTSSEIYTPVSLGIFSHTIILPDGVIVPTSMEFYSIGSFLRETLNG